MLEPGASLCDAISLAGENVSQGDIGGFPEVGRVHQLSGDTITG